MPTLYVTRGLPASGKTTYAHFWVAEDPAHRARVNRDDIRAMLNNSYFEKGVTERRAMAVRDVTIRQLLHLGLDVICDDTNLPQRTARDLAKLARLEKADVEFIDFTHVPLETCLERERLRMLSGNRPVALNFVIMDMYDRYLKGKTLPLPDPCDERAPDPVPEIYVPDPSLPDAVIVDIDGTVALKGDRDPFDESRVHEDRPNERVTDVVRDQASLGYRIIFCSGRTDACRTATEEWLVKHVLPRSYWELNMRRHGDGRKDAVVKRELFDEHIRPRYNVRFVLDDRQQVVDMWRSLGLLCLPVAPGDF
jgi:predicted kinase